MKRSSLPILFLFGTACLIIACSANRGSATAHASGQGDLKRSFSVQPGGKLIMDVSPGSVEIRAAADQQVVVEVFRSVERANESRAAEILRQHEVTFEQQANNLSVHARANNNWFKNWNRHGLKVRYVVSVPTEFHVDLKTSGGGISVDDLRGEVRARTSGGGLRFGKIEGPITANTSGGGISVAGCKGKVELHTSGGGIEIGSGEGELSAETSGGGIKIEDFDGNVFLRTGGGEIRIDRVDGAIDASTSGGPIFAAMRGQPRKDCRLHTSGGGITLDLVETAYLNIAADASGGSVVTELPITVQGELRKDSLRGTLNGGGQALILQASGGSIYLRKLRRQPQ